MATTTVLVPIFPRSPSVPPSGQAERPSEEAGGVEEGEVEGVSQEDNLALRDKIRQELRDEVREEVLREAKAQVVRELAVDFQARRQDMERQVQALVRDTDNMLANVQRMKEMHEHLLPHSVWLVGCFLAGFVMHSLLRQQR